jgi:hypothetical protein
MGEHATVVEIHRHIETIAGRSIEIIPVAGRKTTYTHGVSEEPKELLPEQRKAAVRQVEEVSPPRAVEFQKHARNGQRWKRKENRD